MKKLLVITFVISLLFVFVACDTGDTGTPTKEPTATPVPTDTPEPTNSPAPTDTPEPDPDEGVDAILYRFAYEGEEIIYNMFNGVKLQNMNSELEFTEEGLQVTVEGEADPYFYLPLPGNYIELDEYPIFLIRFKTDTKGNIGEVFIAFDGEAITGPDQNYRFEFEKTEDWQVLSYDLRKLKEEAEGISNFRLDLLANPSIGDTYVIDYVGFFASQELADSYLPPNLRVDSD